MTDAGRTDFGRKAFLGVGRLITLLMFVSLGMDCATERPFVWVQSLPPVEAETRVVIHPRDTIVVHVQGQAAMTGEFVIREDGGYLQPTLGNVSVGGRTPADVAAEVQARLKELIVEPSVSVSIARIAPVRVNVIGEVRTPGVYELTRDRTVAAALATAGWLTDFAAEDRVFVVRAADGETRIRFRAREITAPETHTSHFRLRDGDVVIVE